jgi:ubiquitin C-terminal hydrolase
MFTYLLFSNFGIFIPKDFVYSIKEKNNEQMITNMQKDSQEFFSDFCEKIEESIKNTNQKYLIKNLFSGKFCYINK